MEIMLSNDALTISTKGLISELGYEISATVDDIALADECRDFVIFVAKYVSKRNEVKPEETLAYGYWLTKARYEISGHLSFWECAPDAREYVAGVSNTLRYWREQHQVCNAIGSVFSPPNAEQLITVSEGVFEGDDVQGVRYRSPSHMSGWWITTDRYDGALSSLKNVHAYHLTARRPDLARFLALAVGYRFYSDNGEVRRARRLRHHPLRRRLIRNRLLA